MKYLLTVLMAFALIISGCKKSSTNSGGDIDEVNTHVTVDVKTPAIEYFNFSTNSGSADETSAHDIVFYSEKWNPTDAPSNIIIDDPRFRTKNGLSIAVLEETKLADVTDVPTIGEFVTNFISEKGEWYYMSSLNVPLPYDRVYIVNTVDGKFPAFEIIKYIDEEGELGFFNIEWKYLSE